MCTGLTEPVHLNPGPTTGIDTRPPFPQANLQLHWLCSSLDLVCTSRARPYIFSSLGSHYCDFS